MRIDTGIIAAIIIEYIVFIYYSNSLFYRKKSKLFFALVSAAMYIIHFFVCTLGCVPVNILTYITINYILFVLCFHVKKKTAVYQSVILSTVSGMLELAIIILGNLGTYSIARFDIVENQSVILTVYGKSLYFVVAVILAKFFKRNNKYIDTDSFLYVGVLVLSMTATFFSMLISYDYYIKIVLCVICVAIDIIVVALNQRSDAQHMENEYLQIQLKKDEKTFAEIASLRYLHHDMDEHLRVLYHLIGEDSKQAKEYIESLNEKKQQSMGVIEYTDNSMINIVLSEKIKECSDIGIKFILDPVAANLAFFSDMNAVTIFSNLLNNAIESCRDSSEKRIYMRIYTVNDNFVVIKTENSSDRKSVIIDGKLKTSKDNELFHGIGISSIRSSLKPYNGKLTWSYNEKEKVFCSMITIQHENSV